MGKTRISRRQMLKSTVLAAAGFTIVPRHVLGGPGYTPPSEQLTRGIIGTGGMGRHHIDYEGARLLAICDVDKNHLQEAARKAREKYGNDVTLYSDFRELLERPDIDIVHIPTPPHWHAYMAVAAARAGKDIWCEKPMTRTIAEGLKVVEAVQKNGRMFRINTWFRMADGFYDCGASARLLKRIAESGILGWPLKFTISKTTGFDWKLDQWHGRTDLVPEPVPEELNYDLWLGPAPVKPYHPHRVHQSFRGYWDYDGGGLGDMGQHYCDPVQYIFGKDNTGPVEIEAEGPEQHPDAVGFWDRISIRYADGCEILLDAADSDKQAAVMQGPRGKLFPGLRSDVPNFDKFLKSLPDVPPQNGDFMHSVRTRTKFELNEMNGHRSCSLVNLSKIAVRLGRKLRFDPVKQVFVNDEEANRLIDEPARAPWVI